ncbi:glycoside hydrolase family 20 zincin-like fold domain-containing protein [Clostridium sp. KNHs205]|uniref:glycoside hydrolase family 20 zincin-like fold domain-containing protein n=1 Tax=Clostridium sp. KNHs205 TaxID=1449050 RepID=UPI00051CA6C3|nr:glycoside hydrolase family 20 zincin-like fold domain-containing protein [Clostridium sp. KNHs205]
MYLIPEPQKMIMEEDTGFVLRYNGRITVSSLCDRQAVAHAAILKEEILRQLGFHYLISKGEKISGELFLGLKTTLHPEGYQLIITKDTIELYGGSSAGILYGIQTLRQIINFKGAVLPALTIEDYPVIENRGFYHDITRGRIPTLQSLKELADKMSYYKMNQLQLYIEHSFLFRNFSEVWRDDTPLTAEEILELDQYCRNLHIDLVPSIATFGHLYKVLRTKTYSHLCELEGAEKEPFSFYERMGHHTLDISNKDSFAFITEILQEFIPLFSSEYFNLCADETFDLGKGKSKAMAEKVGLDNMYIDFVGQISEFLISKGKKPMFWGDIICGFPEAVKKLPEGVICLNWGYEPNESEDNTKALKEAGALQYVCPGVNGWNRLINNYRSAYDNISRMSSYAVKYQAEGILNTDWGDFGHINHPEFSLAGMIYGAAFSWNAKRLEFEDINCKISRLEYGDATDTFLSVVNTLSEQNAVTWYDVICFKELKENAIKGKPYSPVLEDISWDEINATNVKIDNCLTLLYRILSTARQEKRYLYKAYFIAGAGMKLFNEIGAFAVCGPCTADAKEQGKELAVRLEYWHQEYKELWRSVSKESELYRISEVAFWYADYLRVL